jgi:hypothetical protein
VGSESDVSGLEVKRDGVAVGRAEYGASIPVDPGLHRIEARAPTKKTWSTNVDVAPKQTDAHVTVALLDDVSDYRVTAVPAPTPSQQASAPAPTGVAPAADRPPGSGSAQRVLGVVTLGAGVAGVAVGSVFGLIALSKNNEALQPQNCPTSQTCKQSGLSLTADAKDAATVSTIAFGVGAAAVVAGVVLWLTAPTAASSSASVHVAPEVGRSYGGVSIAGAW